MALPNVTPMELVQQKTPFDHPDWLFEIKYDGFRSLAYVEDGCKLVSRNEFHYQRFKDLAESIVSDLDVSDVILGGEIVCLDDKGHTQFYDLLVNAAPHENFSVDDYRVTSTEPTRTIEATDEIDLGNRHFEVMHLPGYSPSGMGLWEADTGTLFSGDGAAARRTRPGAIV